MKATVFAPASIGNVGPGFDILGLALEGVGDTVSVELADEWLVEVTGRDAGVVPTDPRTNTASIAASAMLRRLGNARCARLQIAKGLPVSGGLGGSAASSVAGAYAAALAVGATVTAEDIILAALEGESFVSGRHLDNLAPITVGGLVLARSVDPVEIVSLPVPANWSVATITPHVRIETRRARAILPDTWDRASWIQQMANTAALIAAFANADGFLARRALDDLYAEPRRAPMIPCFSAVKTAALQAGAFGCSISGAGPTMFAIVDDRTSVPVITAMQKAMTGVEFDARVSAIARRGARPV